jgi:hypothetical protein
MSEKSKDKTKRKYIHYLTSYKWVHRYSVFYEDMSDSIHLLNHMIPFKQALRRKYKETPFLIRIQLLKRFGELQAFLVITTTCEDLDIKTIAAKHFPFSMKVIDEGLSEEKIASIAEKISSQRPHDLDRFFGKSGVNRWSLLNKSNLIPHPE